MSVSHFCIAVKMIYYSVQTATRSPCSSVEIYVGKGGEEKNASDTKLHNLF